MAKQVLSLEERVNILQEFIDTTYNIGWFRGLLRSFLFEFQYRGKNDEEPAVSFRQMKDELKPIVQTEEDLMMQYDQLVFRGKYTGYSGPQYIEDLAAETRRMRGLPEDADINLIDGSDEWNAAKKVVLERRRKFEEERKKTIDYESAFETLVNITKLRVGVYAQLVRARDLLGSAWDLSQQPYTASFTSGSETAQARLEDGIRGLLDYIQTFPNKVAELLVHFPAKERLEIRKALPKPGYTEPQSKT